MEIPYSPQKGAFEHQTCFAVPAGVTLQLDRDYTFFFFFLSPADSPVKLKAWRPRGVPAHKGHTNAASDWR